MTEKQNNKTISDCEFVSSRISSLTLADAFKLAVPLLDPIGGLIFARINIVKFFKVAETAIELMRHTAGAATSIKRTITPAKYMLVSPYIMIKIMASDNRLKQK